MAIKDVLRVRREQLNIKQEDVAEIMGISKQTYSKWENGKTEPKASQVAKLSEVLKVSSNEICNGELNVRYEMKEFLEKLSHIRGCMNSLTYDVNLPSLIDDHKKFLSRLEKIADYEMSL